MLTRDRYNWGATSLMPMYGFLGDVSMFTCKQLNEYATLIQLFIITKLFIYLFI